VGYSSFQYGTGVLLDKLFPSLKKDDLPQFSTKNLSNRFSAPSSYHFLNSTTRKAFNNIKKAAQ
jgi:hypothetical protein